jgi:hypothetical protein
MAGFSTGLQPATVDFFFNLLRELFICFPDKKSFMNCGAKDSLGHHYACPVS